MVLGVLKQASYNTPPGAGRKNGHCFTEQKNYDAARKTAGYFRCGTPARQEAPAEVYKYLCPPYNCWYPSFRLIDKVKQADERYRKVYEKFPATPYQRLLESPEAIGESKVELKRRLWRAESGSVEYGIKPCG